MEGYIKGRQYAYEAWNGSQIRCKGKHNIVDHIILPQTIAYDEDTWLIEETELLADNNNLKDINKNRLLNCKPIDNTCTYNGLRYIWDQKEPNCKMFETKKVRGIITSIDNKKISAQMTV